jgi:hypothetical protein
MNVSGQAKNARAKAQGDLRLTPSFIRTMTVGSGISPDLLTLGMTKALAGSSVD